MFPPEKLPPLPLNVAESFARVEGWYAEGQVPNRPQRNNNPGDLEFGEFTKRYGAIHGDPRFAVFPEAIQGWAALYGLLLSPEYASLTIEQAIGKFAPANENDVANYVSMVCLWSGKKDSDLVSA